MSLDSLSLSFWDFLGPQGNANQRVEGIGGKGPAESIYQGVFEEIHGESDPIIDPWRQSMKDITLESYLRELRHSRSSSPHRNSHLTPVATASSYPTSASLEDIGFNSPLVEPNNTNDGYLHHMYPSDTLAAAWDTLGELKPVESSSYSRDMAWASGTAPTNSYSHSSEHVPSTLRPSRTASVQRGPSYYQPVTYDSIPQEKDINDNNPRDHPLYKKATTGPDGLYHCPWENKDPSCNHKPDKLRCNYNKFVDSHLKPYRCKVQACQDARFSSTACLLRHEREAHTMYGHRERPFLCTFHGCEFGVPGNGFPRHWNLLDHMRRVHNRSPSPSPVMPSYTRSSRRIRRRSQNSSPSEGLRRDRTLDLNRERDRHSSTLTEPFSAKSEAHDINSESSPKALPAQMQFRDKTQELIALVMKVRNVDDKDALRNLRAAEDCLKFLTTEVMKTKAGPREVASNGDVEMPD